MQYADLFAYFSYGSGQEIVEWRIDFKVLKQRYSIVREKKTKCKAKDVPQKLITLKKLYPTSADRL